MSKKKKPEKILVVEKQDDGQYYVKYQGREYGLLTPIQVDYEFQPEDRYVRHHFRFTTVQFPPGEKW